MLPILERLRRPAATAAELKVKLHEVEEVLPAAEKAMADAEAARAAGLLTLSDRDLERIEADMARARRDRDRLRAVEEELRRRVGEAERTEATAKLDAEREAVERKAAAVAARLRRDYADAGAKIVVLLEELVAAEEAVRTINRRVVEAGRDDVVAAVENRVVDHGRNSEIVASLLALTSLRPVGAMPGWGMGRDMANNLGLPA